MATFEPPFPLNEDSRRQGRDPQEVEALFGRVLSYIYHALPDPPVTVYGDLCILFDDDGGGVDRLSLLPDSLLADIVSRLPVKDAARTAALSRRWRPVWRAAPLVLLDTHLLPDPDADYPDAIPTHLDRAASAAVAAAVSRVLAAHPGPFRCVRLACCYMDEHRAQFERWIQILARKGVHELFLINRPWPLEVRAPIPAAVFGMASLTCLYLSFWKLPDTADLPRGTAFPRLRELGLYSLAIQARDLEFFLSRSPVLEVLCFDGLLVPLRLRLVSHSLRCLQVHMCNVDRIAVADAPRLERLFVHTHPYDGRKNIIKIGNAPALRLFGQFGMKNDELQVGNTIIKAGTVANARVTVPAVKTLDVQVRFGVRSDAKMLPSFLRCFPNVDRLHIHSKKTTETTGRISIKFWQESDAIKCALSRITLMSFQDFRGDRNEVSFLKFVIESAPILKTLVIVYAKGCFGSKNEATSKAKCLFAGKRATKPCMLVVCESKYAEGGGLWDFGKGSDFSCNDPFGHLGCSSLGVGHWSV